MRRKRTLLLSLFAFCLIAGTATAQRYLITDLGPLTPIAINSWAQIVGNYNNRAYIWTLGRMRSLGTLPGGTFSRAGGINDLGVVVGTADGQGTVAVLPDNMFGYVGPNQDCSNLIQPFIWKQQMQGLGTVAPASDVEYTYTFWDTSVWCDNAFYGSGINNRGQVIGYTEYLGDIFQWGILWTPSEGMSLLGWGWETFPNQISNTGQIVGESGEGFQTATSWKDGVATSLGGLPGNFLSSVASGVNDQGQVVGWSINVTEDYSDRHVRAVMWTREGMIRELGTLSGDTESIAKKINMFGIVIGDSGTDYIPEPPITGYGPTIEGPVEVVGRPFIWSERTGMRNLNTLIPQNSGWVLQSATDINVWGQIVGQGTRNGQPHGYLLTPLNPFQVF